MRIVLLTTDTSHHLYYARQMQLAGAVDAILVETEQKPIHFPTRHAFEEQRDAYERDALLANEPFAFEDVAHTRRFASLNAAEAREEIERLQPDLMFVFGTGLLKLETIGLPRVACLNLHGGNPEEYRGLDSHLWTIYHRDFCNLVTTLHFMSPQLDTGDIAFSASLPLARGCALHELRAVNTRVCVNLSLAAVTLLRAGCRLPRRKQIRLGRYYSAMPAVLKDDCLAKFGRYTATL